MIERGYIVDDLFDSIRAGNYVDLLDVFTTSVNKFLACKSVQDIMPTDVFGIRALLQSFKPRKANDIRINIGKAALFVMMYCASKEKLTYSVLFDELAKAFCGEFGFAADKSDSIANICAMLSETSKRMEELDDCNIPDVAWASASANQLLVQMYSSEEGRALRDNDDCKGAFMNIVDMSDPFEVEKMQQKMNDIMLDVGNEGKTSVDGKPFDEIMDTLDDVITEKQIKNLADEIVRRSLSKNEDDKVIVVYGSNLEVHHYLASMAMEYINKYYTGFAYQGSIEYRVAGQTCSEQVIDKGSYRINMCIYNTADVDFIYKAIKAKSSEEQTTIIITDIKDNEGSLFGKGGYKFTLSKRAFTKYINNNSSLYLSGMRFEMTDSAKKEVVKLINAGRSMHDIFNVTNMACAEAIINGNNSTSIDKNNILKVLNKLEEDRSDETELVKGLREKLGEGVKGQDEALDAITRAVKIAKAGLNEEDKPIASFMFVGPTGTGKTETAKQLAKALDREFIRIDMGDYKDQTAVNKFSGASAGYIGYDDGSVIGKAMKGKEHCVLLFDEIEKAHSSVYDVMMHMLDNGEIKDNKGKAINFRDAIIIMTSNAGARQVDKLQAGFNSTLVASTRNDRGLSDCVQSELELTFKPEFINRFDAIIQYNKLNLSISKEITIKLIRELEQRAKLSISLTDSALEELASKGTDIRFGAREIKRVIDRQIKAKLAEAIIDNGVNKAAGITVDFKAGEYNIDIPKSKVKGSDKNNQN